MSKKDYTLKLDSIDSFDFLKYNNESFSELVSPTATFTQSSLFFSYDELKDFFIKNGSGQIFVNMDSLISNGYDINETPSNNFSAIKNPEDSILQDILVLQKQETDSHSYIASSSLSYVNPINNELLAIFDTLISLKSDVETLTSELQLLKIQESVLQRESLLLKNTYTALTIGRHVGFQLENSLIQFNDVQQTSVVNFIGGTPPFSVEYPFPNTDTNIVVSVPDNTYTKQITIGLLPNVVNGRYVFHVVDANSVKETVMVDVTIP
jgi:hypothetical protein